MCLLSIWTHSSLRLSHLPGPALSKMGIPGKCEETNVTLLGIRASYSYAALDHLSRSLKKAITRWEKMAFLYMVCTGVAGLFPL